jgi:hypothetical protein
MRARTSSIQGYGSTSLSFGVAIKFYITASRFKASGNRLRFVNSFVYYKKPAKY